MHTSDQPQAPAAAPKRGRYSLALKARLVAACSEPGASVAAIALAHGLKAKLLYRWVSEQRQKQSNASNATNANSTHTATGFVQLAAALPTAAAGPASNCAPFAGRTSAQDAAATQHLQLHFSRGDLQISLNLPAHQHTQCAALLKLVLS